MASGKGLRIAIYSQDGWGLGHLRRNIRICQRLLKEVPDSSILLIADSPVAPFFQLPDGVDLIKLPSIRKIIAGKWKPIRLRIPTTDLQHLRAGLLQTAFINYRPHLVLVDHMPGGAQGELIPSLDVLNRTQPDCSVVLGLRDILDAQQIITRVWESEGAYDAIRWYYDRILIYGSREIFDTVTIYQLPTPPKGIHYCGYVANQDPVKPAGKIRQGLCACDQKLVFVSAGGGADGHLLMRTYLQAIRFLGCRADFVTLMSPGVNAPPEFRRELEAEAQGLPVQLVSYVDDSMSHIAAADLVVSMAGYNTLSEVLSLRKKALIVPRAGPSVEQTTRARLLAKRGLIDVIEPKDLFPENLAERLLLDLQRSDYPAYDEPIDTRGARHAAIRLSELIRY